MTDPRPTAPQPGEPPVWSDRDAAADPTTPRASEFAPYTMSPVVATPPRRRGATVVNVLLGLALVVAIGGIAFAAGRVTAPAAATTTTTGGGGFGGFRGPNASGAPGAFRGGGFGALGGAAALKGTVTAVTPTTITLTVGQATIDVTTDGSTTYHQQAAGASSDVQVGSTVLVQTNGQGGFGGGAFPRGSFQPGASFAPRGLGNGGTINAGTATDITVEGK